ncbi:MAG: ribosomal RNA small subunit methyltransferase A, partial [Bacteroidales bacterium]|nr:ribosomal RNA small subunit methyltransferase A [Bacteroidales bacterium]
APHLYSADFLQMDLSKIYGDDPFALIGNLPYNISSQIFFKILDYRDSVPEIVCMVQKEVAERIASKEGNKSYGILSVLLQCWYDIEYLFTVPPGAFYPPPKVNSAVIRLTRNSRSSLPCDEKLFKAVIKGSFNQRRKTIRNSLKSLCEQNNREIPAKYAQLRPEQLSVEDFIELTSLLENK